MMYNNSETCVIIIHTSKSLCSLYVAIKYKMRQHDFRYRQQTGNTFLRVAKSSSAIQLIVIFQVLVFRVKHTLKAAKSLL